MPRNPTCRRIGRAILAPARRVHAAIVARLDAQDTAARERGWTVDVRSLGGRVYRDPRFDRLAGRTTGGALAVKAGREAGRCCSCT
jgi:hypothetical protein